MDCPKTLLLGLALALSATGCTSTGPALKARTEAAFGNFESCDADAAGDLPPAQKEAAFERARIAYQHALEIDPRCKEAYAGLGGLYLKMGNQDKAAQTYTKALKLYPRDGGLWLDLGICHCRRKDWTQAVGCMQKAHELDPDNRQFTRTLGLTLARAGRDDEAVACLKQVMTEAEAHWTVARMNQHLGQAEACKRHLQLALQLNPELAGARALAARLDSRGPAADGHTANLGFAVDVAAEQP